MTSPLEDLRTTSADQEPSAQALKTKVNRMPITAQVQYEQGQAVEESFTIIAGAVRGVVRKVLRRRVR